MTSFLVKLSKYDLYTNINRLLFNEVIKELSFFQNQVYRRCILCDDLMYGQCVSEWRPPFRYVFQFSMCEGPPMINLKHTLICYWCICNEMILGEVHPKYPFTTFYDYLESEGSSRPFTRILNYNLEQSTILTSRGYEQKYRLLIYWYVNKNIRGRYITSREN